MGVSEKDGRVYRVCVGLGEFVGERSACRCMRTCASVREWSVNIVCGDECEMLVLVVRDTRV